VCPVGVAVVMVTSRSGQLARVCLLRLRAWHSLCPLSRPVGPPSLNETMCRIGASHHGVRQVWSRRNQNFCAVAGEQPLLGGHRDLLGAGGSV